MIQVTGIISLHGCILSVHNIVLFSSETDCCTKEYLAKEVVGLINKLKHKINDMEHKVRLS